MIQYSQARYARRLLCNSWQAILLTFALLCGPAGLAASLPVIYSTDLFHPHQDPDDHFDLACLFSMPEADVRGIVLDQGEEQAKRPGYTPVWQLNYLSGRNVPAAIGLRDKLAAPEDRALQQPPAFQNGVGLILQTLKDSPKKVTVIFVGSGRDVAAAYNRDPGLFRTKVRALYGFIGDAGEPSHREWNVALDPNAFVRLMRVDVPFYWVPCFDGGVFKNNGHASFWRVRQSQVLDRAPLPLQRYFYYMLRHGTNDPIQALQQPIAPSDSQWMMDGQRNLWCGALLGLAVGRPLGGKSRKIVGFEPVEVSVNDQAVIHYGNAPGSRRVMRFEIKDRQHFDEAATRATAHLLETFPILRSGAGQ